MFQPLCLAIKNDSYNDGQDPQCSTYITPHILLYFKNYVPKWWKLALKKEELKRFPMQREKNKFGLPPKTISTKSPIRHWVTKRLPAILFCISKAGNWNKNAAIKVYLSVAAVPRNELGKRGKNASSALPSRFPSIICKPHYCARVCWLMKMRTHSLQCL